MSRVDDARVQRRAEAPMRIMVATHNYPRFAGDPAGAFVARLARGIARRGHDVRVLAPHTSGTPERERQDGVSIERFRYAPDALERVGYRGDLHRRALRAPVLLILLPVFLAVFRRRASVARRAFRPDVIHAHWWIPAGLCMPRRAHALVVTCHGSDVHLLARSAPARWLAARVLRRAAAVTCVSTFLAERLVAHLPELRDRTRVLRMPVDTAHFARGRRRVKADPPRILYAGNLLRSKGVTVLIEALARLHARGIPCTLRVLGEGAHEAALRAHARQHGLGSIIEWSAFVPQDAMPDEYGASTVTVLPTLGGEEGLGLTLVEALLAGCAVVGTAGGGIPEVIEHEVTGLLVRPGDAEDLAAKLERLLRDAPLRDRLTSTGAERAARRFGEDAVAADFDRLYADVAGDPAAR